jgi:enoyl-CoA hydratase
MSYELILIDNPRPMIRRITLNRPEKRNALNNQLRTEILRAVEEADGDPEVRVSILRGAGSCFSAGYDLGANNTRGQPYYTAGGAGQWPRHVIEGSFRIWDMANPVIAQVHGYCLAGASELATACDLVYVAEDAQIGYPPVRLISPPDMQFHPWLMGMRAAMEAMLTGDAISGIEAARTGFANRAFPAAELELRVLDIAERVAKIPTDLQTDEQAGGASRDGHYGDPGRDSRRYRGPGSRDDHSSQSGLHEGVQQRSDARFVGAR